MKMFRFDSSITIVWSVALAAQVVAQGPLTPPGAPEPTMKTLDQVEPRIPIPGGVQGSLSITTPGSYYLTGEREVGGTAIFVRTSRVTIDLNGFALRRTGAAGTGIGIHVSGSSTTPYQHVVVRNGFIHGFGYGIQLSTASACLIENVTVTDVANIAFYAHGNDGNCDGNIFRNCSAVRSGTAGFYLAGDGGHCRGNQLLNCTAVGATGANGSGITLFGDSSFGNCSGNLVQGCTTAGNVRNGIELSASSSLCQGNRIIDCTSVHNGTNGISLSSSAVGRLIGNVIENCQSISNGANGIILSGNGGAFGNKLSGNTCVANGQRGIFIGGSDGGLTIGNLCVTNLLGGLSLDPTDINGPIVTTSGTLGTAGADAHPHANYSRP